MLSRMFSKRSAPKTTPPAEPKKKSPKAEKTDVGLEWNADLVQKDDMRATRVRGKYVVERLDVDRHPLVRTRESITRESGVMTWRARCEAIQEEPRERFYFGVVSAEYTSDAWRNHYVWLLCGDGNAGGWDTATGATYVNVFHEGEGCTYNFKSGDIVVMKYDPDTQCLTAKVEGNPGWSTTRRLEGAGLREVHPCVVLWTDNLRVELLSREGASQQEYHTRTRLKTIGEEESAARALVEREASKAWGRLRTDHNTQLQRHMFDVMGDRMERVYQIASGIMQEMALVRSEQNTLNDKISVIQRQVTDTQNEVRLLQRDQKYTDVYTTQEQISTLIRHQEHTLSDQRAQEMREDEGLD